MTMLLSERHRKSPKCPLKTIGLFDTADAAVDRQVVTRSFNGTTDRAPWRNFGLVGS
jgi:hypothetical protein